MKIAQHKLDFLKASSFATVICLIVVWYAGPIRDNKTSSQGDLLTLSGTLISALSFIVGCFFAYLAVDVFRDSREIEKRLADARKLDVEVNKHLKESRDAKQEFYRVSAGYPGAVRRSLDLQKQISAEIPSLIDLVRKCQSQWVNGGDMAPLENRLKMASGRCVALREEAERCEARALIPLSVNVDELIRLVKTLYAIGNSQEDLSLVTHASSRFPDHSELQRVCGRAVEELSKRVLCMKAI